MHSARWDDSHDLAGEQVAVIGTGASAIQVVPADPAGRRQRGGLPADAGLGRAPHRPPGQAADAAALPGRPRAAEGGPLRSCTCSASSWSSAWPSAAASSSRSRSWPGRTCTSQVRDPKLRAALTPDYTIGCKRILISNDYFPAVAAPNAELVTAGIAEVRPHSIVDRGRRRAPDRHHRAGHRLPRDRPADRREDLRPRRPQPRRGLVRRHGEQPQQPPSPASRTCSCWSGPNVGVGHTSMVYMIESQVAYVDDALQHHGRRGPGGARDDARRRRRPTAT